MGSLNKIENRILEAFKHSLQHELISEESVLADMLKQVSQDSDETSHHSQFRWEGIDDAFNLKMAGSPFKDAITSAFYAVHTYKYLDDPVFKLSFERDLRQRAVPTSEIEKALQSVDQLVEDLDKNPGEQDAGWHPDMKDLVDLTTNADSRSPKKDQPYTGGGHWPENDEHDVGSLEGFKQEEIRLNEGKAKKAAKRIARSQAKPKASKGKDWAKIARKIMKSNGPKALGQWIRDNEGQMTPEQATACKAIQYEQQ